MKAIIISKTDTASLNIHENLMELGEWEEEGEFQGNPWFTHGDYIMATINDEHIFHDDVDLELEQALDIKPECLIYASKHRSESGKRSLTVHPIGNFESADFGGRPKTLVPSAPHLMSSALRLLKQKVKHLDYSVSFEATHHGPFLRTRTFFIEIGSEESTWKDREAGRAIAETILETENIRYPVGIGFGGGHYAPRITDVALEREVSFGHIIPTYELEDFTMDMALKVIENTRDAEIVYFHRKRLKGHQYSTWKEIFSDLGITPVKSADLEQIVGS